MNIRTRRNSAFFYLAATTVLWASAATSVADDGLENRLSTSVHRQAEQTTDISSASYDELPALITRGSRSHSTRGSRQEAKPAVASPSATSPTDEFWIYDAAVTLFSDRDWDGHYTGIDLEFDADTIYSEADVYAVVYLSFENGPWNEYASTEDFTVFGASAGDAYVIETELVSGYLTGEYDLLVELFDAYDGVFLASFGPEDSSQLSFLPLEDIGRDTPPAGTTTIIVGEGGGGSLGWLGLLALLSIAAAARSRGS